MARGYEYLKIKSLRGGDFFFLLIHFGGAKGT